MSKFEYPINGREIDGEELLSIIIDIIRKNCATSWLVSSIGIGCPGQAKNGVVVAASNFPKISNLNIVQKLVGVFGDIPVVLLNDADAVMAAEIWGSHKVFYQHINNAVVFTLGTGIGCGMLLDGRLFRGSNGLVEAGHMIVCSAPDARLCGCGQRGCAEAYASASNTTLRLKDLDRSSEGMQTMIEPAGSKDVFQRYFNNDPNAVQVVEEVCNNYSLGRCDRAHFVFRYLLIHFAFRCLLMYVVFRYLLMFVVFRYLLMHFVFRYLLMYVVLRY